MSFGLTHLGSESSKYCRSKICPTKFHLNSDFIILIFDHKLEFSILSTITVETIFKLFNYYFFKLIFNVTQEYLIKFSAKSDQFKI